MASVVFGRVLFAIERGQGEAAAGEAGFQRTEAAADLEQSGNSSDR